MRRRLKFGHSYQTYNVDLCHTDANLSIAINIQMWIHAMNHTNTPSQPGESNEALTNNQGLRVIFNNVQFYPCD